MPSRKKGDQVYRNAEGGASLEEEENDKIIGNVALIILVNPSVCDNDHR